MIIVLQINWKGQPRTNRPLYFRDLGLNQPFRNAGNLSQGAVYIKVAHGDDQYMYEVNSGALWRPTSSPVEKVNLELNVPVEKPSIYA